MRPGLRAYSEAEARSAFAGCRTLPATAPRSDVTSGVVAAVPVLVVGGVFDPITPATNASLAATTLSKAQLVLVPGGAHGQTDACGTGIKAAFLDTLAPVDASCATAQTLAFYYAR